MSSDSGASSTSSGSQKKQKKPRKLVLCFDGTNNTFEGSTADTNIVKIYDKLDQDDEHQYHYYQTGIGTYSIGSGSLNRGPIGKIMHSTSLTLDSAFGLTFDAHVIAGYRFIMRFYTSGAKIYLFGFSRGAFTAKYLARMINTVGLLSKGNEEMVPFAYQLYQDYELGKETDSGEILSLPTPIDAQRPPFSTTTKGQQPREKQPLLRSDTYKDIQQMKRNKLQAFTSSFCRRERIDERDDDSDDEDPWSEEQLWTGVKVHFLGLFDCVSSVAVLERNSPKPVSISGTAKHVRHAVAVDERRVKFKAALLDMDRAQDLALGESHKEVWFPGTHCDVGGGWAAQRPEARIAAKHTWGSWFKGLFVSSKHAKPPLHDRLPDPYQMSDVPLSWMLRELELLGQTEPENALKWSRRLKGFKKNFTDRGMRQRQALDAPMHDSLVFGGGCSALQVLLWRLQEHLFFIPRIELIGGTWKQVRLWPNMGRTRDIPRSAKLHQSLVDRLNSENNTYKPSNNHGERHDGGEERPCLEPEWLRPVKGEQDPEGQHSIWEFAYDM